MWRDGSLGVCRYLLKLQTGSLGVCRYLLKLQTGSLGVCRYLLKLQTGSLGVCRYLLKLQTEVDAMGQIGASLDSVFLKVGFPCKTPCAGCCYCCCGSCSSAMRGGAWAWDGWLVVQRPSTDGLLKQVPGCSTKPLPANTKARTAHALLPS